MSKDLTGTIEITLDQAELLAAFIRNFEREDIPDGVWDVVMTLYDKMEEIYGC